MSSLAWLITLVLLLTILGTAALVLVTVKYYWGERGTPPATGDERRRLKEEELRLRAKQFELAKESPREDRKPDFFDNSKAKP
jgi:hypothetical protein